MIMMDWFRKGINDGEHGKGRDPRVPRDPKIHREYHRGFIAGEAIRRERNRRANETVERAPR